MIRVMKNSIHLAFIKIGFLKFQVYKEAVIIQFFSNVIFIIAQYFLWSSIYGTNNINNYQFAQLYFYIILGQLLSNIYPTNISEQMGRLIGSGDIGMSLLKPISIIKQLFFENIGISIFKFFILSLPIGILTLILSSIKIESVMFLKFTILFFFAYIFYFLFEMIIGTLSFYTTSQWGIQSLKYAIITLFSGRFLPLSLYPNWAKQILDILPFKLMYNTPIETLLIGNVQEIQFIILTNMGKVLVTYFIFQLLYNNAIKKLVIQGG